MKRFLTSESVTEGHPDKICDQISDAVLDEVLRQDKRGRVACETFISVGFVIVGGEITTTGYVDLPILVRKILKNIGYTEKWGFDYETCAVLNAIGRQSPDIAQGVDTGGAGDQGLMIGYACDDTKELMPLPIILAHKITMELAKARKSGLLDYLGPDGKSQVTVEYEDDKPVRVDAIILAAQHSSDVLDKTGKRMAKKYVDELIEKVIRKAVDPKWLDKRTKYFVNATGKFVIGGPQSDTGMTGRKIIVDTYGGLAPHGGGAFSGKDPTKVDRSSTYMARYLAKNIVKSKLASRCQVNFSYVIGEPQPVSFEVDTFGTGKVKDNVLSETVRKVFDLSPKGIITKLNLLRPIYVKTASYGHFGREEPEFNWEKTDSIELIKSAIR